MEESKSMKIWNNTWKKSIHKTAYARKRIKSARSAKLTPLKIDTTDLYGYFQGSGGRYETFLNYCPCGDFRRSKLPCKHIYRLAIELGLMDYKVDRDINAIVTPQSDRISLDETIDIVESLSDEAQQALLKIASHIRSATPNYKVALNSSIIELMESGIIIDSEPDKHEIKFGRKSEIADLLDAENISYDKKSNKCELEELCMKYIPEKTHEKFDKFFYITIPKKFSPQQIHFYLHRKYDLDFYYDEDNNLKSIRLLDTVLPDDNITKQLIKRGHYSRNSKPLRRLYNYGTSVGENKNEVEIRFKV